MPAIGVGAASRRECSAVIREIEIISHRILSPQIYFCNSVHRPEYAWLATELGLKAGTGLR